MISVVIPTFIKNDKQLSMTIKCIEAAKKTNVPRETIIVETGTNYLSDYADLHLYEKNRTNATSSINRGFGLCSGDYICLLTNDVIVDEGWLEALLKCFEIYDCGLATLATTQLLHNREDKIKEGIWFSLAMIPRKYAHFSEEFTNSWDDTDLIMRVYLDGKKMYRNYSVVVEHNAGQTHYQDPSHTNNFENNRAKFIDKYKQYKDMEIFKILTMGYIL